MPDAPANPSIFGESKAIRDTLRQAQTIAGRIAPVLILAEPGLEVVLLAGQIHQWSGRTGRFHRIYAPEMTSPGEQDDAGKALFSDLFAQRLFVETIRDAQGGTLLIEDIDALPGFAQATIESLLAQQSRGAVQSDVRVIASTSQDLNDRIAQGTFRAGLLERLAYTPLVLPPLREREDDPVEIAERLLAQHPYLAKRIRVRLDEDAISALLDHDWPGNLAELERVVVGAAMQAGDAPLGRATLQHAIIAPRFWFEGLSHHPEGRIEQGERVPEVPSAPRPRASAQHTALSRALDPEGWESDRKVKAALSEALEKLGRLNAQIPELKLLHEDIMESCGKRVVQRLKRETPIAEDGVCELTGLEPRLARRLMRWMVQRGTVKVNNVGNQRTWMLPPKK